MNHTYLNDGLKLDFARQGVTMEENRLTIITIPAIDFWVNSRHIDSVSEIAYVQHSDIPS